MSLSRGSRSSLNGPVGVARNPRKALGHGSQIKMAPIRTKSGCWTCRLRRKRCDEKRLANDSCETCARLRIGCLGWGPKRPDWCRDKKQVTEFLAKMRNVDGTLALTNRGPTPPSPEFTQQFSLPYSTGSYFSGQNGPAFTMNQGADAEPFDPASFLVSGGYDSPTAFLNELVNTQWMPAAATAGSSAPPTASITSIVEGAMLGLESQPVGGSEALMTALPPFVATPTTAMSWDATYTGQGPFPDAALYPLGEAPTQATSLPSDLSQYLDIAQYEQPSRGLGSTPKEWVNSLQQVQYYFHRVRRMQYCFAGAATTDIMRDMVTGEPHGVITNAICALAAVHDYLMRQAAGQEVEDWQGAKSLPRRFFDFANSQIEASREKNGRYTATDATAALQFVSFSLFVGGHSGWELALKVAGDWYETTPVISHEQPLRAMWELNNTAKFASRIFLWFDIFSAITLLTPPRFLQIYRRILGNEGGFWRRGLNMETTMGCPDDVLLAIAETANLAHWKAQQKQKGTLNARELARRGEEIEKALRIGEQIHAEEEAHQRKLEDQRLDVTRRITSFNPAAGAALPASSSSSAASSSGSSGVRSASSSPRMGGPLPLRPEGLDDLEIQSRAGRIFRAGAHLYLASVVADCRPRAPEISTAVKEVMLAVKELPASDVDKSLVFPLCLAGCLAEDRAQRDFFRTRLAPHNAVGNCQRAVEVVDAVWVKRGAVADAMIVDWRSTMEELGFRLLLV